MVKQAKIGDFKKNKGNLAFLIVYGIKVEIKNPKLIQYERCTKNKRSDKKYQGLIRE